jgi:predicted signal transduction protein with EAL and GGDEF domain
VIASEPFDLGQGVTVKKTCSVGWAAYPWSRVAYEAICAEESIALADAALYHAKALGRNQGVGFVSTDAAAQKPEAVTLLSAREANSPFARLIKTECPRPNAAPAVNVEAANFLGNSSS